ncbi:MAG: hypothetical protein AAFN42_24255 [Cyanobacteria bacterium J06554_1]
MPSLVAVICPLILFAMFEPRRIESAATWLDQDNIKIYTVSASGNAVDQSSYRERLKDVKQARTVNWSLTPSFTIFHSGASADYLVLAWWGNDNEMFTSVSVYVDSQWIEDSNRYSFCLWDLEIMWAERNFFVEFMYCEAPNLELYRQQRLANVR